MRGNDLDERKEADIKDIAEREPIELDPNGIVASTREEKDGLDNPDKDYGQGDPQA